MWKKCPDCQKKKNYVPVLSWFASCELEQCPECHKQEKLELLRWEDEGGPCMDHEVELMSGKVHIFRQPHYQGSHM